MPIPREGDAIFRPQMKTAPAEFADLLTPKGRRLLERRTACEPLTLARPFVAVSGAVDAKKACGLRDLIDRSLKGVLTRMEDPIPAWTIAEMRENYAELLPKAVRVKTALLESRRARAYRIAEEIGLLRLLRSPTFKDFSEVLAGRPLHRGWGIQALCYGPGDYTGPHNDHHPEETDARDGYLDVHLTLATQAVGSHFLVYAQDGHLSQMQDVNTVGGITAYRLPFWHYTTPLQAKRRKAAEARRWVLLGTFLFDGADPSTGSGRSEV
jgi:hypothetical protein